MHIGNTLFSRVLDNINDIMSNIVKGLTKAMGSLFNCLGYFSWGKALNKVRLLQEVQHTGITGDTEFFQTCNSNRRQRGILKPSLVRRQGIRKLLFQLLQVFDVLAKQTAFQSICEYSGLSSSRCMTSLCSSRRDVLGRVYGSVDYSLHPSSETLCSYPSDGPTGCFTESGCWLSKNTTNVQHILSI